MIIITKSYDTSWLNPESVSEATISCDMCGKEVDKVFHFIYESEGECDYCRDCFYNFCDEDGEYVGNEDDYTIVDAYDAEEYVTEYEYV